LDDPVDVLPRLPDYIPEVTLFSSFVPLVLVLVLWWCPLGQGSAQELAKPVDAVQVFLGIAAEDLAECILKLGFRMQIRESYFAHEVVGGVEGDLVWWEDVHVLVMGYTRGRRARGELRDFQQLFAVQSDWKFGEGFTGELGVSVEPEFFEDGEVHCVFVLRDLLPEDACGDVVVVFAPD
jgi:hypothetical protein